MSLECSSSHPCGCTTARIRARAQRYGVPALRLLVNRTHLPGPPRTSFTPLPMPHFRRSSTWSANQRTPSSSSPVPTKPVSLPRTPALPPHLPGANPLAVLPFPLRSDTPFPPPLPLQTTLSTCCGAASAGAKRKRKSLARPRELVETADVHDALFSSSQQIRDLSADEPAAPLYIRPMFDGPFAGSAGGAAEGRGGGAGEGAGRGASGLSKPAAKGAAQAGAATLERNCAAALSDVEEEDEEGTCKS